MRKTFLYTLLFSLTFGVISTPSAHAAGASVTFVGGAENFVYAPGSEWGATDLFADLKNAMPGDVIAEEILVKNTASEFDYVKIYLRADPHDEEENPLSDVVSEAGETVASMEEFLSQLNLRVYKGDELIYEASPDQADSLAENILLGTFYLGGSTTLKLELEIPVTLGNEYMHRAGEVDWIFTAEGYKDGNPYPYNPE